MYGMSTGGRMLARWRRAARFAGFGSAIAMLAFVALGSVPASATAGYRAISLGALPGGLGGYATDINAAGVVVGYSGHDGGRGYHATVWKPVGGDVYRAIDLTPDPTVDATATAVNEAGVVVGHGSGGDGYLGIVWRPAGDGYREMVLPPLPGDNASSAEDINAESIVVGVSVDSVHKVIHPALWRSNAGGYEPIALPISADYTVGWPLNINSRGVVVGWLYTTDRQSRAVAWTPAPGQEYVLTDVGTLPRTGSGTARAINPAGLIVGQADSAEPGFMQPVAWSRDSGGGYTVLPLPYPNGEVGGVAEAVNSAGLIAGTTGSAATLWTPSAGGYRATDLGTLPTGLESEASGINTSGVVVGWSSLDGYQYRMPTLWRPEP